MLMNGFVDVETFHIIWSGGQDSGYHGYLDMMIYHTVKPVFNGHLNIPEEVSPHDRCPFIAGSLT